MFTQKYDDKHTHTHKFTSLVWKLSILSKAMFKSRKGSVIRVEGGYSRVEGSEAACVALLDLLLIKPRFN